MVDGARPSEGAPVGRISIQHPAMVLLIGLPRSGTSWIGKIFDSHPDTLYRHEADSRRALATIPLVASIERATDYADVIGPFVDRLPMLSSAKVAASRPVFRKSYYSPVQFALRRLFVAMAAVGSRAIDGWSAPSLLPRPLPPDVCVVWKSIESLGRLGVIVRSKRVDRTIVILRHPCGQIASVLRGERGRQFEAKDASSDDYGVFEALLTTSQARDRGLTIRQLQSLHPVERLAWRWVLFHEKALDDVAGLSECMTVRYEDVCDDPARHSRALLEFANLDWSSQTAEFLRSSTAEDSAGYYSIRRDPAKASSGWRSELAQGDVERIRGVLQESRLRDLYEV